MRHAQQKCDSNFGQDPDGGTASVAGKGETTKSGYITSDPGQMSTIKLRLLRGEVS